MTNQAFQKLAIKIRPFQIKVELILLTILVVGMVLRELEIGVLMILISLLALSILNFIMSFRLENDANAMLVFVNKLTQLASSIGLLAILFTILHYPGATMMLLVSLPSLVFGLIGFLIIKFKDNKTKKIIDADFIRILLITISIASIMAFGDLIDFNKSGSNSNIDYQEITE